MGKLIFLDIDGVLRRTTSNPSQFDKDCLENFESALRTCHISKVVISSTWRHAMSLKELKSRFTPDVATRIIGVTPQCLEEETFERYAEIMKFLEEKNIKAMPWVAIDDDPSYFPTGSPVLFTDPKKGFDSECATKLIKILTS
jgi:hypothetical protein